MNETLESKGQVNFEDALGNYAAWAKNDKLTFPFTWANNSASTETQLKMIRYLNSLIE